MNKLVLHPQVEASLKHLVGRPAHAILLVGPMGVGKGTISKTLAAELLGIATDKLESYPYSTLISPKEGKIISIEQIRQLQHFLSLKIPGESAIARIVIIEEAHLLTAEAQNALLKTLEEPPADTVIVMTSVSADALLPTIRSRVRIVQIVAPPIDSLKNVCVSEGFSALAVDRALVMSGGLPGLTLAVLNNQASHPLYEATAQARVILQATVYERLAMVDMLSKQKQLCRDIIFILGEMARMALTRSGASSNKVTHRWQQVMQAAFEAQKELQANTQVKLVLTNLMLTL